MEAQLVNGDSQYDVPGVDNSIIIDHISFPQSPPTSGEGDEACKFNEKFRYHEFPSKEGDRPLR